MLSIVCSSPVKNGAGRNVVDGDRISKKSEREVYFSLLLRGEKKFFSQWGMESISLIDLKLRCVPAGDGPVVTHTCMTPVVFFFFLFPLLLPPVCPVTLFYLGREYRQVCFVSQVNARFLWHMFHPKRECVACRSITVPTCFFTSSPVFIPVYVLSKANSWQCL